MTPQEVALVQSSFALVAPNADRVAALFYDRLFQQNPALRPLFKSDLSEQGRKLMAMLTTVVKGLSDLPAIVPAAQSLARRHVGYGVRPEHYPPVGAALLWTLEQGLGSQFTEETRAAWTHAYGTLAEVMIEAARAEDELNARAG